MIDMAFAKKRVEDRKEWLRGFAKGTYVDYKVASMSYDTFINRVRWDKQPELSGCVIVGWSSRMYMEGCCCDCRPLAPRTNPNPTHRHHTTIATPMYT